jgi:hypothetical protein
MWHSDCPKNYSSRFSNWGLSMHIHGAQNSGHSLHAAGESSAAMAARQAEANRKKLLGAAAGLDAAASAESAWMIAAWGGGSGGSGGRGTAQQEAQGQPESSSRADTGQSVARTPSSAPVSYWA